MTVQIQNIVEDILDPIPDHVRDDHNHTTNCMTTSETFDIIDPIDLEPLDISPSLPDKTTLDPKINSCENPHPLVDSDTIISSISTNTADLITLECCQPLPPKILEENVVIDQSKAEEEEENDNVEEDEEEDCSCTTTGTRSPTPVHFEITPKGVKVISEKESFL